MTPTTTIERTHALAVLLLALSVTHSQPARADTVETPVQLALHPANADVLLLRYAYGGNGVFLSTDRGATWALTCSSAIDSGIASLYVAGVAADGTVLLAGALGGAQDYARALWQVGITGCGFSRASELMDTWLSDIQPDPTDPDVMFGVSSGLDGTRLNGLWKRSADEAWSTVGPQERMMFSSLRITTTANGMRMYASALREIPAADGGVDGGGAPTYGFVIRMSDDEGETWEEHPVEVMQRASFRLEAIDPKNPDTIIASVLLPGARDVPWKDSKDLVLVSKDRGETFETYYTGAEVGAATFTPDGVLWIGDVGSIFERDAPKGLWKSTSLDTPPERLSEVATQCLTYQPASDTLYACQAQSLGSVDRATGEITTLLRFNAAKQMAWCPGQDIAATCEMQLCGSYCGLGHFAQAPLCRAYDTPRCGPAAAAMEGSGDLGVTLSSQDAATPTTRAPDAGTGAASAADAATTPTTDAGSSSDCGCGVLGSRGAPAAGGFWTVAVLFVVTRRLFWWAMLKP
jgi:hypothetical protein